MMLNQSYTKKNLRLLRGRSVFKHNHSGRLHDDFFDDCLIEVESKFSEEGYDFDELKKTIVQGKSVFDFNSLADELVLKKLNDNIRRLFKISPSDRHATVKQVIALVKDSQPFSIIRLDFKDFYESIDRCKVINFINDEWLLSYSSRKVLSSFEKLMSDNKVSGLPRGLSISSTLSEICLRGFDRAIRKLDGVYYYERYVDDMIIFTIKPVCELMEDVERVKENFLPYLEFNNKTETVNLLCVDDRWKSLDFLGYRIKVKDSFFGGNPRAVEVVISDKKIRKIKKRVERSFRSFYRNGDSVLLKYRMKFLTGNQYVIGDIERTKLKSGIFYNYSLITNKGQLRDLDLFYQKFLRTSYMPIRKSIRKLKRIDRSAYDAISNLSFEYGYDNKLINNFPTNVRRKIRRCW